MSTALCDNPEHINRLCKLLDLGKCSGPLSRVFGGLHHRMWRLETDRGVYAIKQLAPDTDLRDPATITHYNATERVARKFASQGIAAQHALQSVHGFLQVIDEVAYLVYPWTDALAIDKDRISEKHALKVARLLAKMHLADIQVAGVTEASPEIVSVARIKELIQLAVARDMPYAKALYEQLPAFIDISRRHRAALAFLTRRQVISHGDLDQKNVLWDAQGNPVLIDWESAGKLNPTYEAVLEALDWSGITSCFDRDLFKQFVAAYVDAGGTLDGESIKSAFQCVLGEWVDWLMYNVGRSIMCFDKEQRAIGADQISFTLQIVLRLKYMLPELQSILREPASDAAVQV